jgi:hypothetical protein
MGMPNSRDATRTSEQPERGGDAQLGNMDERSDTVVGGDQYNLNVPITATNG